MKRYYKIIIDAIGLIIGGLALYALMLLAKGNQPSEEHLRLLEQQQEIIQQNEWIIDFLNDK